MATKSAPFSMRLSKRMEALVDREAQRTGRSKSAIVEALADEGVADEVVPGDRVPRCGLGAARVGDRNGTRRLTDARRSVRLFLDAHISGLRIAWALREAGHDVRAADKERELDGLTDEELLSIAAAEERMFVTLDVKDFPVIARHWAEAGRAHAGCAIVIDIGHGEFGTILDTIAARVGKRFGQAPARDQGLDGVDAEQEDAGT